MTILKTFRCSLVRRCLPRMDSGWGGDGLGRGCGQGKRCSLGRRCVLEDGRGEGVGEKTFPKEKMCLWRYGARENMIRGEKAGGVNEKMCAGEKTFPREKMCPLGWRRRWGWGEYIPWGENASLGRWG